MIKKNEQQLKYLYGDEVVDALKEGIKDAIKNKKCTVISVDNMDKEIDKLIKKNKGGK